MADDIILDKVLKEIQKVAGIKKLRMQRFWFMQMILF